MKLHLPFPFTGDSARQSAQGCGRMRMNFPLPKPMPSAVNMWGNLLKARWNNYVQRSCSKQKDPCRWADGASVIYQQMWDFKKILIFKKKKLVDLSPAWCNSALEHDLSELSFRSKQHKYKLCVSPKHSQMSTRNQNLHGDGCTQPSTRAAWEFHVFGVFALFKI